MKNNNLPSLVESLLIKAEQLGLIKTRDLTYLRNQFYQKLKIEGQVEPIHGAPISLSDICKKIVNNLDKSVANVLGSNHDIIEANIINTLIPMPSIIEDRFGNLLKQTDIKTALDWYYEYCCHTNAIKMNDIDKNISWQTKTIFGNLQIIISQSDSEQKSYGIGRGKVFESKNADVSHPGCQLCIENEGSFGNLYHPSSANHRLLEIKLDDNSWFFQYYPYSCYNQHAIIISTEHKDVLINQQMFKNFVSFVDQVPHYFIGSNSDVPVAVVGDSILTHDHYMAGFHVFPLDVAEIKFEHKIKQYPTVRLNYLNWPVSTLKLIGSKDNLLDLTEVIVNLWSKYNDEALGIISHTKNQQHNSVTPIMRKLNNDQYCLYLLLRNNRTSVKYPEGIFHPHPNLHHIKKENIGLSEVMGLAVLPDHLLSEVNEIKTLLLLNNKELAITELLFDSNLVKHELWLDELYTKYESFNLLTVNDILQAEIGFKFNQMLVDTGIFKNTPAGDDGIIKFLNSIENFVGSVNETSPILASNKITSNPAHTRLL